MKIEFSIRGNGACPLCTFGDGNCQVQKQLTLNTGSISFGAEKDESMEIVIYSCPFFVEKA